MRRRHDGHNEDDHCSIEKRSGSVELMPPNIHSTSASTPPASALRVCGEEATPARRPSPLCAVASCSDLDVCQLRGECGSSTEAEQHEGQWRAR